MEGGMCILEPMNRSKISVNVTAQTKSSWWLGLDVLAIELGPKPTNLAQGDKINSRTMLCLLIVETYG